MFSIDENNNVATLINFPAPINGLSRSVSSGYYYRFENDKIAFQYLLEPRTFKEYDYIDSQGNNRTSRYYDNEFYIHQNGVISAIWVSNIALQPVSFQDQVAGHKTSKPKTPFWARGEK